MSPSNIQLRRINLIRFILPIILFGIVLTYETWEHLLLEGSFRLNFHFTSEVLFFGILGPTAVFVVFSLIVALLKQQVELSARLETMNRSLEEKVVERTEELAVRNEDLARANAELQKLDQLKSDFVSLVSHELRAPLTTLNGGLELALQDASQMPPESRRILEVMSKESQRLTHLVQTILDVSRLEAGKLTLNPGPVAILPLLRRIVETLFPNAPGRIVWSMPSNLPPVWADETYLEQVFNNLLSNASKYSPQEKPIELSAQLENC